MPGTTVRNCSRWAIAVLPLLCLIAPVGLAQDARHTSSSLSQGSSATSQAALPAVHLDGHYFTRDGRRFLPVGAHWVPAKAGHAMASQWDPKEIEADFAKMRALGYNIDALDLLWAWFEPRPGDYNPQAFQQFDYLVSLAHKYHDLPASLSVHRRRSRRSVLGRSVAARPASACRSGNAAPGDQSGGRIWPPLRE